MLGHNLLQPGWDDLALAIRHQITFRTWGRVRQLDIRVTTDRLVITGHVPSYYHKQLVLLAIAEVRMARAGIPLDLDIQVYVCENQPPAERDGP
jgi:hypothetical protein